MAPPLLPSGDFDFSFFFSPRQFPLWNLFLVFFCHCVPAASRQDKLFTLSSSGLLFFFSFFPIFSFPRRQQLFFGQLLLDIRGKMRPLSAREMVSLCPLLWGGWVPGVGCFCGGWGVVGGPLYFPIFLSPLRRYSERC